MLGIPDGKDVGGPTITPPGILIPGGKLTGGPKYCMGWALCNPMIFLILIYGIPELVEIGGWEDVNVWDGGGW